MGVPETPAEQRANDLANGQIVAQSEHDWRRGRPKSGEQCARLNQPPEDARCTCTAWPHSDSCDMRLRPCGEQARVAYVRRDDWRDGYGVRVTRQAWCYDHDPNRVNVNVYKEWRAYGGPEEGGWWYNTGDPIGTIRADSNENARKIASALWDVLSDIDKGRASDDGRHTVAVEYHAGRHYPAKRPHYE